MNASFFSRFILLSAISALCLINACSSPNGDVLPTAEITTKGAEIQVTNLNADSEERFTLLNLRTKTIVPSSDTATTNWDIGFRKTTIIVNGGEIRRGMGGIQRLTNQDFDKLKEAPASGYKTDDAEDNLALTARSNEGWYLYSGTSITPLPNVVLALRTADGQNFAKIEIQSYYKDKVAPSITAPSRYYSFRYQLAGSNRLFP